jgi:hypothetical protein
LDVDRGLCVSVENMGLLLVTITVLAAWEGGKSRRKQGEKRGRERRKRKEEMLTKSTEVQ